MAKRVPLIPIKDYFARVYFSYYPYTDSDLIPPVVRDLPILYLTRGTYSDTVVHRHTEDNVLSGVVVNDWGEEIFTLQFESIIASFNRYFLESTVPKLANFFQSVSHKKGYFGMEEIINYGLKTYSDRLLDINSRVRWSEFVNSGENILRQLLLFYRHNGLLFDQDGIPVLTGHVIIETNFGIDTLTPSGVSGIVKQFMPNTRDIPVLGAATDIVKTASNMSLDFAGISDLECWLYAKPMTIYKGKFKNFNFEIGDPYHIELSFDFEGIQRKFKISSTESSDSQMTSYEEGTLREKFESVKGFEFDMADVVEPFGVTNWGGWFN